MEPRYARLKVTSPSAQLVVRGGSAARRSSATRLRHDAAAASGRTHHDGPAPAASAAESIASVFPPDGRVSSARCQEARFRRGGETSTTLASASERMPARCSVGGAQPMSTTPNEKPSARWRVMGIMNAGLASTCAIQSCATPENSSGSPFVAVQRGTERTQLIRCCNRDRQLKAQHVPELTHLERCRDGSTSPARTTLQREKRALPTAWTSPHSRIGSSAGSPATARNASHACIASDPGPRIGPSPRAPA